MSLLCFFCAERGIRSRLRARSGTALTAIQAVIHYRPVRIPLPKFTKTKSRKPCGLLLFVLAQREGFEPSCALAQTDFESAPL